MSNYRISKVLSELNIGLDTAVDYLKSKGHVVDKNRNAKINQREDDFLLENFATDKTKKDEAETLIQQKRDEKEALEVSRHSPVSRVYDVGTGFRRPCGHRRARDPRTRAPSLPRGSPFSVPPAPPNQHFAHLASPSPRLST